MNDAELQINHVQKRNINAREDGELFEKYNFLAFQ
jgi:hypothetical protein